MNNETQLYNKTVKVAKISATASAILAAVIALSYFFALRFDFDYSIGHFERGSALFYILVGAIIAAVAIPAGVAIYSKGKASITALPAPSGAPVFLAVFSAAMAIFAFSAAIPDISKHVITSKLAMIAVFGLIVIALALITTAIPKTNTSAIAQIALALAAVAMNVHILASYFDQTLPLNSPVRYVTMLAELCVMFFLLSEARLAFGTKSIGGREIAHRASFRFFVFANNIAALSLGFSVGALAHELIPGGTHTFTANHPSVLRLAMYASLGVLALVRAHSIEKISSEYIPCTDETDEEAKPTEPADTTPSPDVTDEN
jgi:hypothetical protein